MLVQEAEWGKFDGRRRGCRVSIGRVDDRHKPSVPLDQGRRLGAKAVRNMPLSDTPRPKRARSEEVRVRICARRHQRATYALARCDDLVQRHLAVARRPFTLCQTARAHAHAHQRSRILRAHGTNARRRTRIDDALQGDPQRLLRWPGGREPARRCMDPVNATLPPASTCRIAQPTQRRRWPCPPAAPAAAHPASSCCAPCFCPSHPSLTVSGQRVWAPPSDDADDVQAKDLGFGPCRAPNVAEIPAQEQRLWGDPARAPPSLALRLRTRRRMRSGKRTLHSARTARIL